MLSNGSTDDPGTLAAVFRNQLRQFLLAEAAAWVEATQGRETAGLGRPAHLLPADLAAAEALPGGHLIWRQATGPDSEWRLYVCRQEGSAPFLFDGVLIEAQPAAALVEGAFHLILGRASDPSGFAHYLAQIESGLTAEGLLRQLAASPEAAERQERMLLVLAARPIVG